MVNSVSGSSPVSQCATQHTQRTQQASRPEKTKSSAQQDTVELSDKAKAASGDQDHDGH
jgi:anti-sigma28 factor (negative regulator of flagellin synthesis)